MKFILGLIICSSVHQTCLPPHEWHEKFNSHYECMMFGYEESIRRMEAFGKEEVNKYNMFIRFTCTPENTISYQPS
mgnify:CR=1 FL=1